MYQTPLVRLIAKKGYNFEEESKKPSAEVSPVKDSDIKK